MNATIVPLDAFRWGDVAAEHRDWLRKRTEDVVNLAYRQACDLIRIGAILNDARKTLGKGRYKNWVASELPFSLCTAHRYRVVARAFAAFATFQFEMFDPTALYLLAQPKGVTPEVRAHAVALASDGKRITRAVALDIIKAHKPEVWESGAERKADMSELGERMKPIRDAEKEARKEKAKEETEEERLAHMAEVGAALTQLAGECRVVHVAKIDDEGDLPLFSVTTYSDGDRPHNAIRRTLLAALQAAGEGEPTKRCPTCGEPKDLSAFGELKGSPDGHNRCCLVCENARIKGVKKKRKKPKA